MIYNCHCHSEYSHDSDASVEKMCVAAVRQGLDGIAITDHCDCEFAERDRVFERISASVSASQNAAGRFKEKLSVMSGVEMGDPLMNPGFAQSIAKAFAFDVILLSVHAVRSPKNSAPFSGIDFSCWTDDEIDDYLRRYFTDLNESMDRFDFDVVSHLTVPLRYICLKYGRSVELKKYDGQIDAILQKTILLDKTLEINTQNAGDTRRLLCPDESIVERYLKLGGKRFSLGSDAHRPAVIDCGLKNGIRMLLENNVRTVCRFQNRERIEYPISE